MNTLTRLASSFGPRAAFVGASLAATLALAAAAPAAMAQVPNIGWNYTAEQYRGQIGRAVTVRCAAGMPSRGAWGTDVYSDDSSVCAAAVHAGRIDPRTGGLVTFYVQPGQNGYAGTPRNGVTTNNYRAWNGSFTFEPTIRQAATANATPPVVATPVRPSEMPTYNHRRGMPIDWNTTAAQFRGQNGARIRVFCPPGGTAQNVWGNGVFTDDSSICTAAVQAGRIRFATGGAVTITVRPGMARYRSARVRGVASRPFGQYQGSFTVN